MLYFYEGFDKEGKTVSGEIEANSEKDVVVHLETKGLIPSKIRPKEKAKGIKGLLSKNLGQRLSNVDRMFMVRNLATALRAGLSMNEALDILIKDTKPGLLRDILITSKSAVQAGRPFSEALALHKEHFPPIFIGLLKAGETSSQLDKTLDELSQYLAKEYSLVKKVKSALTYPTMLLIGSIMVVFFMLIFVLPRLSRTFALSGTELPLITKVLLSTSQFIVSNLIFVLIGLGTIIAAFIYALKTKKGRYIYNKIIFKTPVVHDLIQRVALVRFTRTLQSLFAGATPVLRALEISAEAVGNVFYKRAILDVAQNMKVGVPLSEALEKHQELFPVLLTSLIGVGEKTGNLEYVLKTFADFYDEEVENKLKDLTNLFEPVLLIVMGLIVGSIAVAVLLPIYQLVGNFV